jgi:hypothetical protein
VEAAIDQRSKLGVLGDRMAQYTQLQAAEAIKVAAENPGGLAGAGVGLGAGVGMGQIMGQAMQGVAGGAPAAAAPPPAPGAPVPPPPPGAAAPPPPPAPAAPRWSLAVGGQTYGPYTDEALRAMIATGQVAPNTMAWHPGAAGWAPLRTYPGFGEAGGTPPPPPPPPVETP